jgi:hypothetical protein
MSLQAIIELLASDTDIDTSYVLPIARGGIVVAIYSFHILEVLKPLNV